MNYSELHVYDLDDTLYRSPKPSTPSPTWYYHAHLIGEVGGPGFDPRWNLNIVTKARRSCLDDRVLAILLTGRPEQMPMRKKIEAMLSTAGLDFRMVVLQPIIFLGTTAQFKASVVKSILERFPTIKKVTFADDQPDNLKAVEVVTRKLGRSFEIVPL